MLLLRLSSQNSEKCSPILLFHPTHVIYFFVKLGQQKTRTRMPTKQNNIFEKHPKKTLFTIIFIAFVIIDFGAAAVLKTLGLFEPSYISSEKLEATYRRSDPVFHHALVENIEFDRAEWGRHYYTVRTNSLGFKDSKIRDIPLQTNKKRILLIGDSFTEGVGIEFKDTFAGIIQHSLAAKNIEVLNAAATSYAPIIYLRKVQYLLDTVHLKFDHLVVLIDLSDMEDESKDYQFDRHGNVVSRQTIAVVGQTTKDTPPAKQKSGFKEFISQNTVLLGRVRNLAGWLRNTLRPWGRALNQHKAMWTLDDELYKSYAIEGLELAGQHMLKLKALLDKHHISLTVVVYPWPDQIFHSDLDSRQVKYWQAWSSEHQVNFINLFPVFIKPGQNPEDIIKANFIPGDVHWNKVGHHHIAKNLLATFPFRNDKIH